MSNVKITAESVLSEVYSLADAKLIASDMRKTVIAIEKKYGPHSCEAKIFENRYNNFVDAMIEKFAA